MTDYLLLKRKIILDLLEKFPDIASKTLAKIARRDNPKFFKDIEDARNVIRRYRGTKGKYTRETIKNQKYYK